MNRFISSLAIACLVSSAAIAGVTKEAPIKGNYLEARTCDVFTAACFANAEVNLNGKEAILAWQVTSGSQDGIHLDGLTVAAVVRASATLGDTAANPLPAKAIVYVDDRATSAQRDALVSLAKEMGKDLVSDIIRVETVSISMNRDACGGETCASLKVSDVAAIEARCLYDGDKKCGNDVAFYTPLTDVDNAMAHFTTYEKFTDKGLDISWTDAGRRGTFIASFSK
ncbi:MAG: DUF1326 domain-containing protein [Candidatus Hydrogenedentota bacterium]